MGPRVHDGHDEEEDGEVVRQVEEPVVGAPPQGQGDHDRRAQPGLKIDRQSRFRALLISAF